MVALTRLTLKNALIPATTALATLSGDGRIKALKAGANVIMPNLSPIKNRANYALYDNKAHLNEEAAEGLNKLKQQVLDAGYKIVINKGDYIEEKR